MGKEKGKEKSLDDNSAMDCLFKKLLIKEEKKVDK